MKNKLNSSIAQIMCEAAEFGYCPNVTQVICSSNQLPFYLLREPNEDKAALVGLMLDYYENPILKAYIIDYSKWNWASYEGFNLSDVFEDDNLYNEIFEEIPAHRVSKYLVSDIEHIK